MKRSSIRIGVFCSPSKKWTRPLGIVGLLAFLSILGGVLVAPERTWAGMLVASFYLIGLPLGATLFLATQAVTGGGWHVCFKRVPEAIASTLPFAAALLFLTLAGGMGWLYEWSHPDIVNSDPILAGKAGWLNVTFFLGRAVLIVALWWALIAALLRVSRKQAGVEANRRTVVLSALFLVVFAPTFSVASFDWLMSLEAHWFSTLFAGYHFAGAFVSGISAIAIAVILLRRQGYLRGIVNDAHIHDLGKLLLGFSSFWAYLWFSQYMLIWYGNLPEEVTYFQYRHAGAWAVVAVANLLVGWLIPFLVLLPRSAKRNESLLLKAAGLLLVAHWLDLYLAVQPVFSPAAPVLGLWELAPILGAAMVFLFAFRRGLAHCDVLPTRDSYYLESLSHHH